MISKKIRKILIFSVLIFSLCSCELIDIHPYDGKIDGQTNLNSNNIAKIESLFANRDTIRFAVISDTQRWYDETEDEMASINRRGDIDFVIHCGDMTDFGVTKEFEWQRDILQKLRMPYVVLLGNHDCIGSFKTRKMMIDPELFANVEVEGCSDKSSGQEEAL